MSEIETDERLYEALAQVEDLLRQERQAISSFDAAALQELSRKKSSCLEALRPVLQKKSRSADKRLSSILMQATANHALLQDTISLVSSSLGFVPSQTYDHRARLQPRASRTIEHNI